MSREEDAYVIERMGKLLAEIAIVVNGPEPPLTRWSYHDLPEKVRALKEAQQPAAADEVAKHSTQDCYEHFLAYSGLEDSPWIKYAYFHGADVGLDRPSNPAPVAPADEVTDEYARAFHDGWLACERGDAEPPHPKAPPAAAAPLFLLHTGTVYGNERGDWEVEAESGKAVDAYCDANPGKTVGLYLAPPAAAVPAGKDWQVEAMKHAQSALYWRERCEMLEDPVRKAQQPAAAVPDGGSAIVPADALREVIRISDRSHPAWDAVKAAMLAANKENNNG